MPLSTLRDTPEQDNKDRVSLVQQENMHVPASTMKTWTRLAVGAVMVGMDLLSEHGRKWVGTKADSPAVIEKGMRVIVPEEQRTSSFNAYSHDYYDQYKGLQTVIGVVADAQNRVSRSLSTMGRLERLADRLTSPVMKRLRKQALLRPIYRRFDRMVRRGEEELERWEEIGKIEEERSRALLKTATMSTFDSSIDYLSTNPDIQDLVQVQSTSLLNDLIEEVRERAVSINTVLEGWVRKTLGLIPRNEIPGPPPEVRRRAELFHAASKRAR